MKKIILILAFFVSVFMQASAQHNNSYMALGVYLADDLVPLESRELLKTKLQQIGMASGISDVGSMSRFILTPKVSVIGKEVLGTAPTQVVLNLDISLCIGDGYSGKRFAYKNFNVKGVGRNEQKAYISALNRIRPSNKEVTDFISRGKQKIIDYYNANCSFIVKEVSSLEAQQKYEQALGLLVNIPFNSDCFEQTRYDIQRLYQMVIDRRCASLLARAKAIWVANQDINSANKAGALLARVEPNSACFGSVSYLFNQIEQRVRSISDRPWEYKLKVLDARISVAEGAMEIMRIYAENQPTNVAYHIGGWF